MDLSRNLLNFFAGLLRFRHNPHFLCLEWIFAGRERKAERVDARVDARGNGGEGGGDALLELFRCLRNSRDEYRLLV